MVPTIILAPAAEGASHRTYHFLPVQYLASLSEEEDGISSEQLATVRFVAVLAFNFVHAFVNWNRGTCNFLGIGPGIVQNTDRTQNFLVVNDLKQGCYFYFFIFLQQVRTGSEVIFLFPLGKVHCSSYFKSHILVIFDLNSTNRPLFLCSLPVFCICKLSMFLENELFYQIHLVLNGFPFPQRAGS